MSKLTETDHQSIVQGVVNGEIAQAAKLISRIEAGDSTLAPILGDLFRIESHSHVLGITGPPGAGKSTIVDKLIAMYRASNETVAVLAVDPSSPFSGGALLGDRVRMSSHDADEGVFIRSMSSRGHLGGLSKSAADSLTVLGAMGWDRIIIETVGVGQNETDIVRHADTILLLQTPQSGDAIQAVKAGILEIADIFIVNKADHLDAPKLVSAIKEMISFKASTDWESPVVETCAIDSEGIPELLDLIEQHKLYCEQNEEYAENRLTDHLKHRILEICYDITARKFLGNKGDFIDPNLIERLKKRESDPYQIAYEIIH